jgi:hypothetical protein
VSDSFNKQAVFDRVAKHLLTQKHQSLSSFGCAYRSETGGRSCAIGCLIPDSKYDGIIEGLAARNLIEHECDSEVYSDEDIRRHDVLRTILREEVGASDNDDYKFLELLQLVHDTRGDDVEGWRVALDGIAISNELDSSILSQV